MDTIEEAFRLAVLRLADLRLLDLRLLDLRLANLRLSDLRLTFFIGNGSVPLFIHLGLS